MSRVDVALCKDQFRKVLKKMLQTGAELNGQNRHGLTPLHEAALRGNVAVVQVLLEQDGLALDARTQQSGETALIYAARSNYPNILNLLLDAGANANIIGSEGTALDVAVSLNRREAAKTLRSRVKDPCKLCGRPFFALCFHVEGKRKRKFLSSFFFFLFFLFSLLSFSFFSFFSLLLSFVLIFLLLPLTQLLVFGSNSLMSKNCIVICACLLIFAKLMRTFSFVVCLKFQFCRRMQRLRSQLFATIDDISLDSCF